MDRDEIKQSYSMRQILDRYGLVPNRAGFICCPFHKEKTPSMKIYKDSFHCFGCGENGDVFSFVEKMDNLTFKEAYLSLGGEYKKEKNKFSSMRKIQKAKMQRKRREERLNRIASRRAELSQFIEFCKLIQFRSEPLSDDWCMAVNKLVMLWGEYDYLEEEGEKIEFSANGWSRTFIHKNN